MENNMTQNEQEEPLKDLEISDIIGSEEIVISNTKIDKPKPKHTKRTTDLTRRRSIFKMEPGACEIYWDEDNAKLLLDKLHEWAEKKESPFIQHFLVDEMGLYLSSVLYVAGKYDWFKKEWEQIREYTRETVELLYATGRVKEGWAKLHLLRNYKGYEDKSEIRLEHNIVKFKFGNDAPKSIEDNENYSE